VCVGVLDGVQALRGPTGGSRWRQGGRAARRARALEVREVVLPLALVQQVGELLVSALVQQVVELLVSALVQQVGELLVSALGLGLGRPGQQRAFPWPGPCGHSLRRYVGHARSAPPRSANW
jgi:hypothetical protein